jgi:hypothetical protein
MSVLSALADGCRRALRAPAVLVGVWLACSLVPSAVLVDASDAYVALIGASAMDPAAAVLSLTWNSSGALAHAALSTFLLGGVLDRLARDRATASFGFFGACGMYWFRFLRLWIVTIPLYVVLFRWLHPALPDRTTGYLVVAVCVILLHTIFDFAKVRMVVEDRRSAIGAVASAIRFVRRNPASAVALTCLNALVASAVWWLAATFAIGATAAVYAYLLARSLLRLIFAASEISLFQSRLAHAGYTARPLPTWPESPAAEAVLPR